MGFLMGCAFLYFIGKEFKGIARANKPGNSKSKSK